MGGEDEVKDGTLHVCLLSVYFGLKHGQISFPEKLTSAEFHSAVLCSTVVGIYADW